MGVYIKGMEMPTGCDDCEFCKRDISGYDWCCVPMMNGRDKPLDEPVIKPDWCPLVPVPEHGRLGDLDALTESLRSILNDPNCPLFVSATVDQIVDCAPTIIPADKEEEHG